MDRKAFDAQALTRGIRDPGYYDAIKRITQQVKLHRGSDLLVVGISGAQGSGKSTLASMLVTDLQEEVRSVVLSLDDFYKTRRERQKMAALVHPLFEVRGVPGTHDITLLNQVIEALKTGSAIKHPVFNKGKDEREKDWRTVEPVDVLVLEGWCLGAVAQVESSLSAPINQLEQNRDPDGSWRRSVNDALASPEYQQAFDCDILAFLVVPNMDAVFRWRLQQERALATGSRMMDDKGIREFIMYYERITRAMLLDLPGRADIPLLLDEAHCMVF